MKRFISLLIAFLLTASPVSSTVLTGQVVDREGVPIADVNIQSDISSIYGVTDKDGNFKLSFGDENPAYITFSHVSFQPVMKKTGVLRNLPGIHVIMSPAVYPGQKIIVTAMRAQTALTPIAFADVTAETIERDYTVADFPKLLETTPNMYSYSFTGGLTGASDFKIRGFDYKRIGVYINGIPLNDPEDRFTYFYDLADFAANVTDIQVQRGVGNSLYGDATFGGSINIALAGPERKREISLLTGYGQYFHDGDYISDIRKQAFEYSSGLIDGRWSLTGRYSKLYSGGYRDYSWYDGTAYFFSVSRIDPNMTTTVNIYGGPMKAHLAFNGIDRETLKGNRTLNPNSYANEIDNFSQPHYELHNTYRINDNLTLNNALYYIRGKGYYEQFKEGKSIDEYNIPLAYLVDDTQTDINIIRQKWVTKNQYGWNPRLEWDHVKGTAMFGGAFYYFDSDHWGDVISATNINSSLIYPYKYYQYFGKKYSASIYALDYYSLTDKIKLMGNLQLRYLRYDFDQILRGSRSVLGYSIDWLFLSPRAGITYLIKDKADIHVSFGMASREPADNTIYDAEDVEAFPQLEINSLSINGTDSTFDFGDPLADAERLYNFEIGGNYRAEKYKLGLNLFWMEFRNEIIANGSIDSDGRPQLGNVNRSVHTGIELDGSLQLNNHVSLTGNISYNHNRIKDHIAFNDTDYDGIVDDTVDYSGNPVGGFPEYIGNIIADVKYDPIRLTYRWRAIGKQFVENGNNDSLAIGNYMISSLSIALSLGKLIGSGDIILSGHIDNLWNVIYEQSGYAYIWWGDQWAGEYYPGAERNFFIQLKWKIE